MKSSEVRAELIAAGLLDPETDQIKKVDTLGFALVRRDVPESEPGFRVFYRTTEGWQLHGRALYSYTLAAFWFYELLRKGRNANAEDNRRRAD